MTRSGQPDADDMFADTRMSFGDHIEELRTHLWRAIIGFLIAIVVSFGLSIYIMDFIKAPVIKALKEYHARRLEKMTKGLANGSDPALEKANQPKEVFYEVRLRDLARVFGTLLDQPAQLSPAVADKDDLAKKIAASLAARFPALAADAQVDDIWVPLPLRLRPIDEAISRKAADRIVDNSDDLTTFEITEGMMVYLKISLLCGLVLGSPWIFYQLWSFVGAGLYSNEKKLVHVDMPFSLSGYSYAAYSSANSLSFRKPSAFCWSSTNGLGSTPIYASKTGSVSP